MRCVVAGFADSKDPNAEQYKKDATQATRFLLDTIIPKFVQEICESKKPVENWAQLVHAKGINVRQLGIIRSQVVTMLTCACSLSCLYPLSLL